MGRHLLTLVASAATLALANVAVAEEVDSAGVEEPILLTNSQMDGVTAGTAGGSWFIQGDALTDVVGFSDNIPGVFANSSISANTTCFSGTCFIFTDAFAVVDGL